jgi:hypothetical protein
MSENVGASTSRNPKGLHGLYRDNFTLPYLSKLEEIIKHRVEDVLSYVDHKTPNIRKELTEKTDET